MPRTYKPVETKAVQWAKVLKLIEDEGNAAISIRELARRLGDEEVTPELEKSITLLQRQGKVRVMMGRDKATNRPARVVQPVSLEPTKRETLGGKYRDDQPESEAGEADSSEGWSR